MTVLTNDDTTNYGNELQLYWWILSGVWEQS